MVRLSAFWANEGENGVASGDMGGDDTDRGCRVLRSTVVSLHKRYPRLLRGLPSAESLP